jgi:hypothetical protein
MSAPHSPTINDVGVLPSSTRHFKKRNDDKIVFENQKPTALQEASPVRLNTVTTDQVNTKHAGLLATKSEKTPPGSVPRHRNKAGVKITKIQTISDTLHVDISSSTIKRKQNEVSHPGKTPGEASQMMVRTPSSPEDISLLSVFFRSSKTKRIRQTSCALWKLPIVSEINTEFSDPETILLGPQTARLYAVKQDSGSEEASRSQSTVTDDSGQLQTPTDRAGENLPHEHKINSPLHIRTKREDNQDPFTSVELESIFSRGRKGVGAAQKSLLKIIPLELLQHLGENSRSCPARTTLGQRCKNYRPTRPFSAHLQSLATFKPSVLLPVIQQLTEVVFCTTHRKVAFREIQTWREEFQELAKIQDYESIFPVENERLLALICWIRLLGRAALSQLSPSSFLQTAVGKIAQTELPPVNPIQDFKPYINKGLSGTISEELAKLLTRPLKKSDIKYQGSMYIFSQRGNFGHLKIGRSGNVSRRLKQWNKQCKKTMEIYFPVSVKNKDESMPDMQQVPHISRVEALVHLELYHHRRIEHKCPGCDKLHLEWFEVSKDIAIGVVRKWSAWMATLPYEKHMKDGEEQWILKSEEREQERLDKLCRPGITFSTPSLPVVKEEETLSSSPSTLASKCQVRGKGVGA